MTTTTMKELSALIATLNEITGSPNEPYTKMPDNTFKPNPGCFHLAGAYGGWNVHRMNNEQGGITCPIFSPAIFQNPTSPQCCALL